MWILLSYFILFLVVLIGTKLFQIYAVKKNLLDYPNERSAHVQVKPRGAGIVFVFFWSLFALGLVFFKLASWSDVLPLLPGALIVATVGYLDDRYHLPARWRFLAYLVAAVLSAWFLKNFTAIGLGTVYLHIGILGSILAVLILLWSTNLFNFMDGTDGLSTVEALFVLGMGGAFLWLVQAQGLALLAWGLVAALYGYLCWNWPPAKVFMGDVGSAFLGFVIAVFALIGQAKYGLPIVLWVILYGIFWVDTTITLVRRILAGEKWYEAHRSHAYQRLFRGGWTHQQILFAVIAINLLLSALAWLGFYFPSLLPWITLLAIAILVFLYWRVERYKPMFGFML